MSETKVCAQCRQALPLDAFGIRRASEDGRDRLCLGCAHVAAQIRKDKGTRRRLGRPAKDGFKTCIECGKTKPIDDFHHDRQRQDGLNPRCKECRNRHRAIEYTRQLAEKRGKRKQYRYRKEARLVSEDVVTAYADALKEAEAEIERLKDQKAELAAYARRTYLDRRRDRKALAAARAEIKRLRSSLTNSEKTA